MLISDQHSWLDVIRWGTWVQGKKQTVSSKVSPWSQSGIARLRRQYSTFGKQQADRSAGRFLFAVSVDHSVPCSFDVARVMGELTQYIHIIGCNICLASQVSLASK